MSNGTKLLTERDPDTSLMPKEMLAGHCYHGIASYCHPEGQASSYCNLEAGVGHGASVACVASTNNKMRTS